MANRREARRRGLWGLRQSEGAGLPAKRAAIQATYSFREPVTIEMWSPPGTTVYLTGREKRQAL